MRLKHGQSSLNVKRKGHRYLPISKRQKVEACPPSQSEEPGGLGTTCDDLRHDVTVPCEEMEAAECLLKLQLASCTSRTARMVTPKTPKFHPKRYPWELKTRRSPRKLKQRRLFFSEVSETSWKEDSISDGLTDSTDLAVTIDAGLTSTRESLDGELGVSDGLPTTEQPSTDVADTIDAGLTSTRALLGGELDVSDGLPTTEQPSTDVADAIDAGLTSTRAYLGGELGVSDGLPTTEQPSTGVADAIDADLTSTREFVETRSIGIQCNRPFLCYDKCKKRSERDFRFFTGVTQKTFEALYTFIGGDKVCYHLKYAYTDGTPRRRLSSELSPKDRLLMTLVRLRRGVPLRDLAVVFDGSTSLASSIVYTWIRFLSLQLDRVLQRMFVSSAVQNANKPDIYKKYPNLRVVLECAEFKFQKPFHFQMQSNTYSSYKATNTLKYLIGSSCYGGLSFLSKGFEGSMSDKEVVQQCGFYCKLRPGDSVMCDRGFDIEAELNKLGCNIIIPAFLGTREKFSAGEATASQTVAKDRIFVEVLIKRIKDFRILRGTIPNKLLPIMDDMLIVCGVQSQFDPPFIGRATPRVLLDEDDDSD